jgi:phosphate starvation-inducible membrane PsiE
MKAVGLACVGFFLGAILGGVLGVVCGLIWTQVFHTTSFEGYDGMLVFFTFLPLGALIGGSLGAAGLAYVASRDTPPQRAE